MPSTRASTRASKSLATPTPPPPPPPPPTSYTLKGLQASETYKIPSSKQPLIDYDPIQVVFCLLWEKGSLSAGPCYQKYLGHDGGTRLNLNPYQGSLWYFTRLMMVHVSKVMVGKGMQLPEGKALKDLASKVPYGQHDWFVEQFEKQVRSRGGGGWGRRASMPGRGDA